MYKFILTIWVAIALCAPSMVEASDDLSLISQSPKNWAMPSGDYANTRYSKLDQINASNVDQLQVAWTFSTGVLRGHLGGPLVVDHIMYVHTPYPNFVYALDLTDDNRVLWKYEPRQQGVIPVTCCDNASQGIAYGDGKIFLYQADTTLVALDAKTGKVVWSAVNGDPSQGQAANSAPFVVKDKVLVGLSGGDFGVRCHVTAYDLKSGKQIWRAFSTGPDTDILFDPEKTTELEKPVGLNSSLKTWPGDQWRTGGACASGWMSFDPALDLVYYGTGKPSNGKARQRPGDNKWSTAIFARNPDTGLAKWVYQLTPHNEWAYDGTSEMILSDRTVGGTQRRLINHFDSNGLAYAFDRATGELLSAEKYDASVNWTVGVDMNKSSPTYGRPSIVDQYSTDQAGADHNSKGICPSTFGAKGEQPAAYSPDTHLFYVPSSHICMDYEPFNVSYTSGQPYTGATISTYPPSGQTNMGSLVAWDGTSSKIVWSNKEQFSVESGVLATAGGVVFYGTLEGYFKAVDAKSGKELYRFKSPSGIVGNVTTYEQNGRQYLAVLSGVGGRAAAAQSIGTADPSGGLGAVGGGQLAKYTAQGGTMTVFTLPQGALAGAGQASLPDGVKSLQPVYYATDRVVTDGALTATSFTSERYENSDPSNLKYGLAIVSIPEKHVFGRVDRPFDISQALYQPWNIWKLLVDKESDREHFRMRGIAPLGERQFVEALRTRTETGGILLFVHGFGTTFEYAVFKAAQMAFDANFKGQVVVFSWPSLGDLNPVAYIHDQVAADTSSTDLERLFQLLKEVSGKHLYIVAHSLGNKLVLETLGMAKTKNINLNISELVMAAPDVDHIKYNQLAKSIKSVAGNMTMYASSADKALLASGKLSLTTRAGYIGADGQPNLCVGVEAIDVTAVGDDMLQINHDTSTASRMVLEDISELLSSDVHRLPDERIRILKSNLGKESIKYWYYPH